MIPDTREYHHNFPSQKTTHSDTCDPDHTSNIFRSWKCNWKNIVFLQTRNNKNVYEIWYIWEGKGSFGQRAKRVMTGGTETLNRGSQKVWMKQAYVTWSQNNTNPKDEQFTAKALDWNSNAICLLELWVQMETILPDAAHHGKSHDN